MPSNKRNRLNKQRRRDAVSLGMGNLKLETMTNSSRASPPHRRLLTFEKTVSVSNATVSPVYTSITWRLSDCDSGTVTSLATLFDMYRVKEVFISFIPNINFSYYQPGSPSTSLSGTTYSVLDFDDSLTPSSIIEFVDRSTLKKTPFSKPHSRRFLPTTLTVGSSNGGFSVSDCFTKAVNADWVDMAKTSVEHYGVKYAFELVGLPTTSTVIELGKWTCTASIEFRQPR